MKKLFTLLPLILVISLSSLSGQKFSITGTVADSASKPLENATVLLLNASDSSLASFNRTTNNGSFTLKNIAPNADYLLKITFIGYEPYFQDIKKDVRPNEKSILDISGIIMTPLSKLLSAATVTGYRDPVKINGDTTEFNAASFKVQPNASTEDLIKKLPGMEVSKDGTVTAQGQTVTQVLVNGKKFFGKDPKLALQNLPANAVDKVKVYDKKSDQAEFSGVDDGERERTIDLQLKSEFSQGLFGNATAGAGLDANDLGRFNGKFTINKFTKSQQLSFLGMANNVNKTGFSVEDYMAFTGTNQRIQRGGGGRVSLQFDGSESVPLDFGNSQGFAEAYSGGLNYNKIFSTKTELNLSYFYNDAIANQNKMSERISFLDKTQFTTNANSDTRTENQNHRFNLTLDQKLDSLTSLKFTSVASLTQNTSLSNSTNANLDADALPKNDGSRYAYTEGGGMNLQNNLLLRRRFMKKGRNASANIFYNLNMSDRDILTDALNNFYSKPTTLDSTRRTNQADGRTNQRDNYGVSLTYVEPLGNRQYLEGMYSYTNTISDALREVYDIQNNTERRYNPLLSNEFKSDFNYNRGGLTYRLNRKEFSFATGVQVQNSVLGGEGVTRGRLIDTAYRYNYWLPTLRFDYNPGGGKSARFSYETSVREPNIDQLQPVRDNTDPLNIYIGNPSLKPEYNHRFGLNFNKFNQSNFRMIFSNFNVVYTTDKIANAQVTDPRTLRRETTPINVKNDVNVNGFIGFGMPLYKQILRMNLNSNLTYGRGISYINSVENFTNRTSIAASLRLSLNLKDTFDVNMMGRVQTSKTSYSLNTAQNQQFYTYDYEADASYRLPKGFRLSTNFDYQIITGQTFGATQAIPLWGASLSKYFLKKDRGELKLAVVDILNRNTGISRNTDVNFIQNDRVLSLGRYALLSFTYSINPMMGGRGGGMRMMMNRF